MKTLCHCLYLIPVLLFLAALFLMPLVSGLLLLDGIAHGMRSPFHALAFWHLWLFAVCACYLAPVFEQDKSPQ